MTESNKNALYEAVFNSHWEKCRAILWSNKDGSRIVHHANGSSSCASILQWACNNDAPVDVVAAIHNTDTTLIERRNKSGEIPLHAACWYSSGNVVEFLLDVKPQTATAVDRKGNLPIHAAVQSLRRERAIVVQTLLRAHPSSVHATDRQNYTPLRKFVEGWVRKIERSYPVLAPKVRRNLPEIKQVLSLLLAAHAFGTMKYCSGEEELLLMHQMLCHYHEIPIPIVLIRVLLDNMQRSECARPDQKGNFPLHVACAEL